MRSKTEVEEVLRLAGEERCYSEIARAVGVSLTSVGRWLQEGPPEGRYRRSPLPDLSALPPIQYAYLLGMYLGDGHVAPAGPSFELRISCDDRYPGILDEVCTAMTVVTDGRAVRTRSIPGTRCVLVIGAWRHWPVVLPQVGPGRKHERRITLTPWQREITSEVPAAFVRGLIHSDGSRFIARQPRHGRVYEYARYTFSNRSHDIKRVFCEHLELLGVQWTQASAQNIQIACRDSVATLDRYVGPKS